LGDLAMVTWRLEGGMTEMEIEVEREPAVVK
jgi:hypothetical protein